MLHIGIDNGESGAIAALNDDGSLFRVDKMPITDAEVLALLQIYRPLPSARVHAVLEHAQAFPKMGVCSAFNYGKGYGGIQMALCACNIPFDIVVPRRWQAALSCLSHGEKNITKRRAEQLFPTVKVIHATADALLIAEFSRRMRLGTVQATSRERVNDGEKEKGYEEETAGAVSGRR